MLGFGAIGQFALGAYISASQATSVTITPRLGAIGQFALGQGGDVFSDDVIIVNPADFDIAAQAATIGGDVDVLQDVEGALAAGAAEIDGDVLQVPADFNSTMAAGAATIDGFVRRNMTSDITLTGEALLEYLSTTGMADLMRSDDALLGTAAEIKLREL